MQETLAFIVRVYAVLLSAQAPLLYGIRQVASGPNPNPNPNPSPSPNPNPNPNPIWQVASSPSWPYSQVDS